MAQIDHLPWLRPGDIAAASLGYSGTYGTYGLFPFRVVKAARFQYSYDLVANINGFLPLAPYGVTGIPSLAQSYWVANQQLNVKNASNVVNLFLIQDNYEAHQVFIGLSPSYLRIYPQQPINTNNGQLDQQLVPGPSLIDVGWYDGFLSPYDRPAVESELLILNGYEPSFNLANPVGIPITPRLNIFINRMVISPIVDDATAAAIAGGTLHNPEPRVISVGFPQGVLSLNTALYPGAKVFDIKNPAAITTGASASANALSARTPNPAGR